ncbi:MAG: HAMP domain-containing protein, partial [Candidatus Binatia bacterium]
MPKNSVRSSDDERLNTKLLLQTLAAVKKGDFTLRLPSSWSGIDGKIADTLNEIIEMMSDSTKEMERVSRAVGREGKLSQRVASAAARGSWKSRVDAVNDLIENLVRPTAEMARVIGSVAKGNLTETVALEAEGQPLRGEFLSTAKMVNAMVKQLDAFAGEVTRVAREVGTEGKLGGQAVVPGVAGTWKDLTDNVNMMAGNLTAQVRSIADVTIAVANGDLSKKITVDVRGEILQLK